MLRRFLYLDTTALAAYLSALEGGQATESTIRTTNGSSSDVGIDAKFASASRGGAKETEESRSYTDTPEARFNRLLTALESRSDELAYVEVLQPDSDLKDIGIGSMLSWECEIYVPEVIQAMSSKGEMLDALNLMQDLRPAAGMFGLETEGLPDQEQVEFTSNFITRMGAKLLVVGDHDETEWKVSGKVESEHLYGDLDGIARVVGKVSKVLPPGHSQQFVTFPGMNLVSRQERRAMAKRPIPEGAEDQYLVGPALMVDILAIFR